MVYRFDKLPYNYEPGVTRWRHHGGRISACIAPKQRGVTGHRIERQELSQAHSAPPPTNTELSSALTSVIPIVRRSQSLPFIPMPPFPYLRYPVPMSPTPPFSDSKTRIIFPVDLDTTLFGSGPAEAVAFVDHVAVTGASSIPVSVIKHT